MLEFKVSKYITLKLEGNKTIIYVNGKEFKQCKYLLIIDPTEKEKYDDVNSIDEISEDLSSRLEKQLKPEDLGITPEQEFLAHCSNLQAWVENKYNTQILHSNLAFPLLKKLTEVGDHLAKAVFKEEIARRLESGYSPIIEYLINERYIDFLEKEESFFSLLNPDDAEVILTIDKLLTKDTIRPTVSIEAEGMPLHYYVVKDKRVIALHLENMRIHKFPLEVVEKITDLTNLQTLELCHTDIEGIPESFSNLQQLKKLNLSEIFIGGKFPEAITRISSLETINLSRNYISSIPIEIENLKNLKELHLELNQLETLPNSITNLSSLEILNLEGNILKELPQSIGKMKNIKRLKLARNNLKNLPQSIGNLPFIEYLELQGNNLTKLPKTIHQLKSLDTLFLNYNKELHNYITQVLCKKAILMKSLRNLYLDKEQMKILPPDCNLRYKRKKIIKLYR